MMASAPTIPWPVERPLPDGRGSDAFRMIRILLAADHRCWLQVKTCATYEWGDEARVFREPWRLDSNAAIADCWARM